MCNFRGKEIAIFGKPEKRGAGILDIYSENNNCFLTCGYDTTIQQWDTRVPEKRYFRQYILNFSL